MSKYISSRFLAVALLLFLLSISVGEAARSLPAELKNAKQEQAVEEASLDNGNIDEGFCGGAGEEECLMRRTLAAHTDYIYTKEKKD